MHVFTLQYGKAFISILFYLVSILERIHGGLLPMAAGQSQHLLLSSFPDPGAGRTVSLILFSSLLSEFVFCLSVAHFPSGATTIVAEGPGSAPTPDPASKARSGQESGLKLVLLHWSNDPFVNL